MLFCDNRIQWFATLKFQTLEFASKCQPVILTNLFPKKNSLKTILKVEAEKGKKRTDYFTLRYITKPTKRGILEKKSNLSIHNKWFGRCPSRDSASMDFLETLRLMLMEGRNPVLKYREFHWIAKTVGVKLCVILLSTNIHG